jgi:N-acetylglutamate synthase-like GNAT family acetyltransferase
MVLLTPLRSEHVAALEQFLGDADLTTSGLNSPSVRIWVEHDEHGRITASTGFEVSADGKHALIRSVAVDASQRRLGTGTQLAEFALERAAESGAQTAWLFSRRSGPFWRGLGFDSADRDLLASHLADAHQVRLFLESGRMATEVAWSRQL